MVRYQRDRGLETSPNRQLLERTQANSWEQAADQAFPSQSSASLVDLDTLSNEGVLYERPLSAASASTQTDADDMVKLRKKLVMALSREDCLKEERKHLRELFLSCLSVVSEYFIDRFLRVFSASVDFCNY